MKNTIVILGYILLSCLWEVTYTSNSFYLGSYYMLQTTLLVYILNEYRRINPIRYVRKILTIAIVFSLLKLPYEIGSIIGFKMSEETIKVVFYSVSIGVFIIVSLICLYDKRSS